MAHTCPVSSSVSIFHRTALTLCFTCPLPPAASLPPSLPHSIPRSLPGVTGSPHGSGPCEPSADSAPCRVVSVAFAVTRLTLTASLPHFLPLLSFLTPSLPLCPVLASGSPHGSRSRGSSDASWHIPALQENLAHHKNIPPP